MSIASVLVVIFAIFPAFIGISAKAAVMLGMLPETASAATILYTMANMNGAGYGILASMGVLAAIMSTGPAMLLVISTTITRDLYCLIKPDASSQQQIVFGRIMIVVVGIVAIYGGLHVASLLSQAYGAFQLRSVAGLVVVIALFWPRVDARAAFWSMLLAGVVAAIWHFSGNPYGLVPLYPSMLVGLPVMVILTLMAKDPIAPGAAKYMAAKAEYEAELASNK